MIYSVKSLFDSLNSRPDDIQEIIENEAHIFLGKGYGTPELEMKFLHRLFLKIQEEHPKFESFSWGQCNAFNDNYFHFELSNFVVNGQLYVDSDIDFYFRYSPTDKISSKIFFNSTEYPDPDEVEFAKSISHKTGRERTIPSSFMDEFWKYLKEKYKHLEIPCLKFLVIIKLLEVHFSMYYFLYTFGNGVEVKFNKEGIVVTKIEENELDGYPLGVGMEWEDDF